MLKRSVLLATLLLVVLTASCAFAQQQLSLKQGFNFIGFTAKPDAAPASFKSQFPQITEIYSFSAASGSFVSVSEGTLMTFAAGRGYIISCSSDLALTVAGTAVQTVGSLNLKAGFNLVGISKAVTAVKFSDVILKNSSVKGIYKWSPASGSFISAVRNTSGGADLPDGIDATVAAGQAYFINMASDTMLTYDSGSLVFGGGQTPATADEDAIRALYARAVDGIKTRNVSTLMSCYSENFLNTNGDGATQRKADVQAEFSKYVYASGEGTIWTVNSMTITGDTARTSVSCKTVLDGRVMENETYNYDKINYLKKENGTWLIVGNQKLWNVFGFTAHMPGRYFVELYLDDPQRKVTAVTINGPGVTSSNMPLVYGYYSWLPTKWCPNPMPDFGSTRPAGPFVYTFTITVGQATYTETLDLGNTFVEELPTAIAPADNSTASSKPVFSWSPVGQAGAMYQVQLSNESMTRLWQSDDNLTGTSVTYPNSLAAGTYKWQVVVKLPGRGDVAFSPVYTFKVQSLYVAPKAR